jgi:hypothetical protein
MSFSSKCRAASPTPPGGPTSSQYSPSPQPPNFQFPAVEPNSPQDEGPQDPFTPHEDTKPQGPGERDLAQALEHLAEKIARMPSTSKSKTQVKPRVPDTFDGSDPGKLETFIFQCNMYIAI